MAGGETSPSLKQHALRNQSRWHSVSAAGKDDHNAIIWKIVVGRGRTSHFLQIGVVEVIQDAAEHGHSLRVLCKIFERQIPL